MDSDGDEPVYRRNNFTDLSDDIVKECQSCRGPPPAGGGYGNVVNVITEKDNVITWGIEDEPGQFKELSEYLYKQHMEVMPKMKRAFEMINTDVEQSSTKGKLMQEILESDGYKIMKPDMVDKLMNMINPTQDVLSIPENRNQIAKLKSMLRQKGEKFFGVLGNPEASAHLDEIDKKYIENTPGKDKYTDTRGYDLQSTKNAEKMFTGYGNVVNVISEEDKKIEQRAARLKASLQPRKTIDKEKKEKDPKQLPSLPPDVLRKISKNLINDDEMKIIPKFEAANQKLTKLKTEMNFFTWMSEKQTRSLKKYEKDIQEYEENIELLESKGDEVVMIETSYGQLARPGRWTETSQYFTLKDNKKFAKERMEGLIPKEKKTREKIEELKKEIDVVLKEIDEYKNVTPLVVVEEGHSRYLYFDPIDFKNFGK